MLNRFFCLFPLRKDKVLFLSDVREQLSGNFGFVYEAIEGKYLIKTSLKGDRRIRRSFCKWLEQCYDLATAKYILLDDYSVATAYIHVRREQKIVQLWHSSGAYKKFAYSRGGTGGDIRRVHAGYKRYTDVIVSSEDIRPCFAEAFRIPVERVLATGIPRTDIFFDEGYKRNKKIELYNLYPEWRQKKVILFAPTYRGTKVEEADYDFSRLDFEQFIRGVGEQYIVLVKWHPALQNNIKFGKTKGYDISKYPGVVYDISESREINDYLFVTDILVTDYSSLIFDYALLNKPVIYYAYDLEEYKQGRGLYFPFEEYVYGAVAQNTDELIEAVREENMCEEKRRDFIKKFISSNDGKATQKVVKAIFAN